MKDNQAETKVLQAQTTLVLQQAFFGLLALNLEPTPDETVPTTATDSKRFLYNPIRLAQPDFTNTRMVGNWGHEVMHCVDGHFWRTLPHHDRLLANLAQDLVIDPILIEAGMDRKMSVWVTEKETWEKLGIQVGMPWEEVYEILLRKPVDPTQYGTCGVRYHDGEGEKDSLSQQVAWQLAVQTAASAAKARGQLPGSLEKYIGQLLEPTVPWQAVLWRFLQASAKDDFSYRRPSQRGMQVGAYLPTMYSETVGEIVWVVDTSGSTREYLTAFASEFNAVLQTVKPSKLWVMYADSKVQKVDEFEQGEGVVPKIMPGGGGTSFCPAFEEVEARGIEPVCLIYITDLEGQAPKVAPEYPVLWVTPNKNTAPWGETVRMRV